MQIKCGVENVPEVTASEPPNSKGTNIVQHVYVGRYMIQI